jgi:hypothetical protein
MPAMKLSIYVLPPTDVKGHPFIVIRRTTLNAKGRYVSGEEILKVGVLWPSPVARSKEALARILGHTILDEVENGRSTLMEKVQAVRQFIMKDKDAKLLESLCAAAKQHKDEAQVILDEDAAQEIIAEEAALENAEPDDDMMEWESDARNAIEGMVSALKVVKPGLVTMEDSNEDGYVTPMPFTNLADLRDHLDNVGQERWFQSVPFDSGEAVFEWGYYDMVDEYLDKRPDVLAALPPEPLSPPPFPEKEVVKSSS